MADHWLQRSDVLFTSGEVQAAVTAVARQIEGRLAGTHPLVLAVMGGAVVFVGQLLPLLAFPLDFGYVHATRYGSLRRGGELHWKVAPGDEVRGRTVLLVDDILDEGETLAAIRQRVLELGAAACYSAVLVDKQHGRSRPVEADFAGVMAPDRYLFGFGMDVEGDWRNLPEIRALKE